MANKTYKVVSEEAVERFHTEAGGQVELDLDDDQARALLAAGWLEEDKPKKKES